LSRILHRVDPVFLAGRIGRVQLRLDCLQFLPAFGQVGQLRGQAFRRRLTPKSVFLTVGLLRFAQPLVEFGRQFLQRFGNPRCRPGLETAVIGLHPRPVGT
jgi:hypothetical protein